jgi:branched-chain amino acid transport system substrate-binding protein
MAIDTSAWSRRRLLKTSAALGAGLATPHFFVRNAWSQDQAFCNNPTGANVVLGFNVPQSGPYADEGADELRAFQLAVQHLNGEGDGGLVKTLQPSSLKGNGSSARR